MAGLICLTVVAADGQMRKADFVTLVGDTDDALRLAKGIKDLFATDPTARGAVSQAQEVLLQGCLEEKSPLQLTDHERAVLQNPELYDKPVLRYAGNFKPSTGRITPEDPGERGRRPY